MGGAGVGSAFILCKLLTLDVLLTYSVLGGYPLNTCPVSLAVSLDLQELSHFPLTAAPGMRSALETGQEGCDG